jgi:hypothetical protein
MAVAQGHIGAVVLLPTASPDQWAEPELPDEPVANTTTMSSVLAVVATSLVRRSHA